MKPLSFQKRRQRILPGIARPTVFANLGYGALDATMAKTTASCLERRCDVTTKTERGWDSPPTPFRAIRKQS
jgi:hypothetical protein